MIKKLRHIAIIMDGNGRWAKSNNRPRIFGHSEGVNRVKDIVNYSVDNNIEFLALYAFSSQNWYRHKIEIKGLMKLIISTVDSYIEELIDNNVKINIIGDVSRLPLNVSSKLDEAVERTSMNNKLTLNLAINYGAKEEILRAVKLISREILDSSINLDEINESLVESKLYTSSQPDPDLLIRTGGESRLSNFLLWQLAYSEIIINTKYWPDYGPEDLSNDIEEYMKRERMFGKISDQIISSN